MGLKLLHTADWHLDSPFSSLPGALRERLRQAQRKIPSLMGEICRREECGLALLAGDIFDGVPSRETVEALKRELARWEIPVCISPGNHDFYGLDSPWRESWPENVYIFTGKMEYRDFPQLDCRVYGGGYRSMDCPPLLEHFRAQGQARWCLGLLHGDGLNPNSPYCPVSAAQVRESGLDIPEYDAYYYGYPEAADEILAALLRGDKRATTGLRCLYELEQEPLPKVGQYSVILDSKGLPHCITRIINIEITKFRDISEEYAFIEGEGDKSLKYWKDAHREVFTRECREDAGIEFNEDMECVCEYFEVVYQGKL